MTLGILLSFVIPLVQPPPQVPAPSASSGTPPASSAVAWSYVPQRVFDTRQNAFGDFETMLADLSRADVVFVGEQHDDPNTHRLELAIVEGLVRRRTPVVIAMEMFERDVQGAIDQYVQGSSNEQQFLSASRPWPRYATDYRPIVEFARTHGIPVIGSDVPRHVAQDVAKSGMSAVDALGKDRTLAAREVQCQKSGEYYERFIDAMGGHPPSGDPKSAEAATKNDRFYLAQCLKDETMGESIAEAFQKNAGRRATIVHINGAFHSDYSEGTAASARRRMPGRRIAVVSVVPVDDIDAAKPDKDDLKLADYILYTVKQPANP